MKKWLIVVIIAIGLLATAISQYKSILTSYAEFFTVNNAIPVPTQLSYFPVGKPPEYLMP